jgi:hypothetical protein
VASTGSWAFFFFAASLLGVLGISREFRGFATSDRRLNDIIAGDLPTIQKPGKEMIVILGVPLNVRTHTAWLLTWTVGCVLSLVSTIATYVILGRRDNLEEFYMWALFQSFWLVCRSIYFHLSVITDGRGHPVVEHKVVDQGYRILSLATGVSRHLAQVHTRTAKSYLRDLHDSFTLKSYARAAQCRLDWKLGLGLPDGELPAVGDWLDIEVLAVVGDTMLSSIAWIHGRDMSSLDLYDSCLVIFRISKQTFLVPAARVLSGNASVLRKSSKTADIEAGSTPKFIPKLGPYHNDNDGWVYWIPLRADRWLHIVCDLDSLGTQPAEVLDSDEVTLRLRSGNLWVSLTMVDEVKHSVELAASIGNTLMSELLSGEAREMTADSDAWT